MKQGLSLALLCLALPAMAAPDVIRNVAVSRRSLDPAAGDSVTFNALQASGFEEQLLPLPGVAFEGEDLLRPDGAA